MKNTCDICGGLATYFAVENNQPDGTSTHIARCDLHTPEILLGSIGALVAQIHNALSQMPESTPVVLSFSYQLIFEGDAVCVEQAIRKRDGCSSFRQGYDAGGVTLWLVEAQCPRSMPRQIDLRDCVAWAQGIARDHDCPSPSYGVETA